MSKTNINGEEISVITSDIEGAKYSSSPTTVNLINESIPSWQNVLEFTGGNPSEHIAYVSDTGSDVVGEYEVGNPLKPFATFTAAITAVPNGGIIKALGGIYNINYIINISGTNKRLDLSSCQITTTQYIGILGTNNVLDISNCQITGRIAFRGGTNNTIFAQGATVTPTVSSAFLTTGAGDCTVYGGTFDGNTVGSGYSTVVTTGHVTFINSIIKASTQIAATSSPSTFINCEIESLSNTGLNCTGETILKGTTVKGNLKGAVINNTNLIVNNSTIEGETGIECNTSPTNTQNLKITNNSVIKGTNGNGIELWSINEYLLVQDSQISGTTNTLTFNSFERLNNEVSVFNNSYLICGSGNIFVEGYDVTDTGKALVNYCWINKALPVYTDITDAYTTLDTGLQIF